MFNSKNYVTFFGNRKKIMTFICKPSKQSDNPTLTPRDVFNLEMLDDRILLFTASSTWVNYPRTFDNCYKK